MRAVFRRYFECEDCGALLVPQGPWNAASAEERREMRAEGYRRQGVGASCTLCTERRRNGRTHLVGQP